jgi:threonine synthase
MEFEIKCSACNKSSRDLLYYKCSSCGQPLSVQLEFDFETKRIRRHDRTLWHYARFFPYVREEEITTLGEGWTPLVEFSRNVFFKLENQNPTGSFKDRGSTVLVSALRERVKKTGSHVSEDSSGNAGASVAAYTARAGLKAKIYVPSTVSGPKFNQTRFYGAQVVKVQGDRSKVAERAQRAEKGKVYVGHILQPLFRDGIRTLAYEIAEQLDWRVPDRVYLPVSAGTLLLGVISGFRHLTESNVTKTMPKIVACQTRKVSPLYHRFNNLGYTPLMKTKSIADALVSVNPPLLELMVKELKEADGDVVMVDESEILSAFRELAGEGFFVEPSSAVAYASFKKQLENKTASRNERNLIILTGTGLKTMLKPS